MALGLRVGRVRRLRRLFRRGVIPALLFCAFFFLLSHVLPYDSTLNLMFRFWYEQGRLLLAFSGNHQDEWLREPAAFSTDLKRDVLFILKTGYGTIDRAPAQLGAMDFLGKGNTMVVADFATMLELDDATVPVYDAIQLMLEDDRVRKRGERLASYKSLQIAIANEDREEALSIGRQFGWELDAMKFIPALNKAFEKFPSKKWYIMIDDDTLLVKPTLQLLLDHLDPTIPHYIGNAVGDFRNRFGHGGSAFFISRAAMQRLFIYHQDVVKAAYDESFSEVWGDRLISSALIRAGVYLDERYCHYFNGESPRATRIRADRFCSPLVSFHKLNTPELMEEAGRVFGKRTQVLTWQDVWGMIDDTSLSNRAVLAGREGRDHVGHQGSRWSWKTTTDSAAGCAVKCKKNPSYCLSWTWKNDGACFMISWMTVGDYSRDSWSGVQIDTIGNLVTKCNGYGPWGT